MNLAFDFSKHRTNSPGYYISVNFSGFKNEDKKTLNLETNGFIGHWSVTISDISKNLDFLKTMKKFSRLSDFSFINF